MRLDEIPGGESGTVVKITLSVGKSIVILRCCCGDGLWVDRVHAPALSQHMAVRASAVRGSVNVSCRGFAMGAGLLD